MQIGLRSDWPKSLCGRRCQSGSSSLSSPTPVLGQRQKPAALLTEVRPGERTGGFVPKRSCPLSRPEPPGANTITTMRDRLLVEATVDAEINELLVINDILDAEVGRRTGVTWATKIRAIKELHRFAELMN